MREQEINEAVARQLGWVFDPKGSDDPKAFPWIEPHKHNHTYLPDFCHDIAEAWEIVEFLRKEYFVDVYADSDGFQCWVDNGGSNLFAEADTASMSICLAFLKLSEKAK